MFQLSIIVGNLGSDPEKSEKGPCRLSVASSRSYTKDGQKVTETEWHRVTVWGPQGEACARYLSKGRPVLVVGRVKSSEYTDKDGQKKRSSEVIADTVVFLPGGSKVAEREPGADEGEDPPGGEEIPF